MKWIEEVGDLGLRMTKSNSDQSDVAMKWSEVGGDLGLRMTKLKSDQSDVSEVGGDEKRGNL
jgi:hypothetical protein